MADDLDLDELHEAVSAMMDQSKSKRGKPSSDVHETAMTAPKVDSSAEPVAVNKPEPAPAPTSNSSVSEKIEVKRPLPNLSVGRPRGRAMDVFTPKPALPPAPAKVKRQGVTLQPTQQVVPEEPKPAEVEAPKPVEQPAPSNSYEEAPSESQPSALNYQKPDVNEWPDPLDMHGFNDSPKTEDKPEAPSLTEAVNEVADQNTPLVSPFLNTKVEKRPLGAYSGEAPTQSEEPSSSEPKPDDIKTEPVKEPQPVQEQQSVAVEQPPQPEEFTMEPDFQDARQATIPQQYHTEPKEQKTDSRPVFDTKDYHPPIHASHATNHNSAMGWILIIVFAVLLIGALLFAFYMMTGGLDFSVLFS